MVTASPAASDSSLRCVVFPTVSSFNASRAREDWNGWTSVGSMKASSRGNDLEMGAALSDLGLDERGMYIASIHIEDSKGNADVSDCVFCNQKGIVQATQRGLSPLQVQNASAPVMVLGVNLSAQAADMSVPGLSFEPLGTAADRPTALSSLSVNIDTDRDGLIGANDVLLGSAALSGGWFNVTFSAPVVARPGATVALLVTGVVRSDASAGSPVGVRIANRDSVPVLKGASSIEGSGRLGFITSARAEIVIDGAFDDWAQVTLRDDMRDSPNRDIDIRHYAVLSDTNAVSFYMDVEGRVLAGTVTPAPSKSRPGPPGPPGPIEPVEPSVPLPLPVVKGEDTAAILIDADRNISTGIRIWGGLGADYSIQVTGKSGTVLTSALYRADAQGNWTLMSAVPAGIDEKRLETQATFAALGINPAAVDVILYATDWTGAKDYTNPESGRGTGLNVSARSILPNVVYTGVGWPALSLTMTAQGGMVNLYSIESRLSGNATSSDFEGVRLFFDTDSDGTLSSGDSLITGSEGRLSGNTIRCAPRVPLAIPEGRTIVVFMIIELASGATPGHSIGLSVRDATSFTTNAIAVSGNFPIESSIAAISTPGGRASMDPGDADGEWLPVAIYTKASGMGGDYSQGDEGNAGGRAPSGGWPTDWTRLTNDSAGGDAGFEDIDIREINATDNSNYLYFKLKLEDLATLYVNDEWDIYFKTYDCSTDSDNDVWYRLSLRVTNIATPTFNSALSIHTGRQNPPDRGNTWTVNQSTANTGVSTDQTMYGYYFDQANDCIYFYVVKNQIFAPLLAPGKSTSVHVETWYIDNRGRWRQYDDHGPHSYTMVPEFQELLLPIVGSVMTFALLRRRLGHGSTASRKRRARAHAASVRPRVRGTGLVRSVRKQKGAGK